MPVRVHLQCTSTRVPCAHTQNTQACKERNTVAIVEPLFDVKRNRSYSKMHYAVQHQVSCNASCTHILRMHDTTLSANVLMHARLHVIIQFHYYYYYY